MVVDGVGVDLWSVGIMVLRLFTNDHDMELIRGQPPVEWIKEAYGKIFKEESISV